MHVNTNNACDCKIGNVLYLTLEFANTYLQYILKSFSHSIIKSILCYFQTYAIYASDQM